MASGTSAASLRVFGPDHENCSNGRKVQTCRACAGNPPRGADCTQCQGFGFNIYPCPYCTRTTASSKSSNSHSSNPSRGSSVGSSSVGRDSSRPSGGENGSGGYGGGIGVGASSGR